ncbi:MAG: XRE family transcriptional regulator [Actinomycetota bacterium]|nr:XRE family transcriptional regulator [Actinomycetota bacterium]
MPEGRSIGEPLRRALAGARLREIDVAKTLGVDPKTVQRWLGGRLPQPRHRWGLADLVGLHEYDLWPHLAGVPSIGPEVYATYPHRGSVPREVWRQLYDSAERQIDILVYSGLFLAEDVEMIRLLGEKAHAGVAVRIILGDPDSSHVSQRGDEEGIHDAMAAKVRNAIVLYRPLVTSDVQIRLHSTVLYNSIYRADGEMLINQHVYGIAAAYAPVLHLRRHSDDDVFSIYIASFERVWSSARPLTS